MIECKHETALPLAYWGGEGYFYEFYAIKDRQYIGYKLYVCNDCGAVFAKKE